MRNQRLSRRRFLAGAGGSVAGVLACLKSGHHPAYGGGFEAGAGSRVAVTQADTYDRALIRQKVRHLFESIGGIGDIVSAGKKVAIKVNITGGSGSSFSPKLQGVPITESMWTHPEVLRAVGELLIDAGVIGSDIFFVEALWDAGSYNNFGYLDVQQYLGAGLVDLNGTAPYSGFVQKAVGANNLYYTSFTVNRVLADVDVYVSIPKMKQHYEAGVTASLKNQVGIVPKHLYTLPSDQGRRAALHVEGGPSHTHLPRSICDLNHACPVHLAVIDGIKNARGGEGVWNPTFTIAEDHVLLAGKDPVATDSIAAYLMGIDPGTQTLPLPGGGTCDNHLDMLRQTGMGTNRMTEIDIVGDGASLVTSVRPHLRATRPAGFELYQNYPNPFNPSTTLRFHLPVPSDVRISVHGITGQTVDILVDSHLGQGVHELQWMPDGVAGGVYFCEMRAGSFTDTRKLIYQK